VILVSKPGLSLMCHPESFGANNSNVQDRAAKLARRGAYRALTR
jgi:hypothetical protein